MMNLNFTFNQYYAFFLTLLCFFLVSCTGNNLSDMPQAEESAGLYIKPVTDRQYPPQKILDSLASAYHYEQNISSDKVTAPNKHFSFHQWALNNGLKINFHKDDKWPLVHIMAIIAREGNQSGEKKQLLATLTLKLLKQGTEKYSWLDFQLQASLLGASIGYSQTKQYSILSVQVFPQDVDRALDLFSQQLAYIKPRAVAVEKIIAQQLLQNKLLTASGKLVSKRFFYQNNYAPAHPYYQYSIHSQLLKNIKINELLTFYHQQYQPQNSQLIISGNIQDKDLEEKINFYFSQWQSSDNNEPMLTELMDDSAVSKNKFQLDFIERQGAQQIDLLFGVVTTDRASSDWLKLKVIATLLGGGPGSRLFSDLREKQGLTYSISARQLSGPYQNPFFIQASIAPQKLLQTIRSIDNHIDYLCHNLLSKEELEQVKKQLSTSLIVQMQTNAQLVKHKLHQLENHLSNNYLAIMLADIKRLNEQQLLMITQKYLCSQRQYIAVGDPASVSRDIDQYLPHYQINFHSLF